MAQTEQPLHVPPPSGSPPKRPKGILKNRSTSNANANITTPLPDATSPEVQPEVRPEVQRGMSEREVVLANTMHNAGHRRSTSRGTTGSRRQSGVSRGSSDHGDTSPRLKWDEVNLYLTEQEREAAGARMKIDEPKTPFAKQYDPSADEAEVGIDPGLLMVDEVDKKLMGKNTDIPDLDIGGPEMDVQNDDFSESDKRVIVEEATGECDGEEPAGVRHGEEGDFVSQEEREKHRRFENMRRKHYEMSNVKDMLSHPEQLDEEDDEDEEMQDPPPVPRASDK